MKDTLCFCATYSYFKEGALKALKRDAMVLTRYVEVVPFVKRRYMTGVPFLSKEVYKI